jgi:hypothetical protein
MNRGFADLNTRAREQSAKRRRDVCSRMLIERLQHKHALSQDRGQHDNFDLPMIARFE